MTAFFFFYSLRTNFRSLPSFFFQVFISVSFPAALSCRWGSSVTLVIKIEEPQSQPQLHVIPFSRSHSFYFFRWHILTAVIVCHLETLCWSCRLSWVRFLESCCSHDTTVINVVIRHDHHQRQNCKYQLHLQSTWEPRIECAKYSNVQMDLHKRVSEFLPFFLFSQWYSWQNEQHSVLILFLQNVRIVLPSSFLRIKDCSEQLGKWSFTLPFSLISWRFPVHCLN